MMRRAGWQAVGFVLFVFTLGAGLGSSARARVGAAAAGGSERAGTVRLEDDRGRALESPVEACFVHELSTDCVEVAAERAVLELRPFDSLRVEGPDHGPVRVRPRDLERSTEQEGADPPRLTVPRKTLLRVRRAPERGLVANLYRPSGDFTRPVHAFDLVRASEGAEDEPVERKVPAGEWVLALESRGLAPQLHSLVGARAAEPGGEVTVTHRPRSGWSLVLRAVDWEDEEPVAGVEARVTPMAPEAAEGAESGGQRAGRRAEPRRATTSSAGLALVSAIERPLADASLEHPDFVATEVPAIGGEPGVIVVREVTLEPGGTVEVAIRIDGEPAAGWRCAIQDRTRRQDAPGRHWERLAEVESDSRGLCRAERVPAGTYWLRAEPPEEADASAAVERELVVTNAEVTRLDLDLSPILIEGDVFRGTEPMPGYRVEAYWVGERSSVSLDEPVARAETDGEGAYEMVVWTPGIYFLSAEDPDATAGSADSQREEVTGPSERIDFHFAPANLEGVVVDPEGNPVAGVTVLVRLDELGEDRHSSGTMLRTGEDGEFSVPLEDEALKIEVSVRSSRYTIREPVTVTVQKGEIPQPVVLTVAEREGVEGTLVGPSGAPVAGGWVAVFRPAPGGEPEPLSSAGTEADGGFRLPDPGTGPYAVYATGPGCPLTVREVSALPTDGWTLSCVRGGGSLRVRLRRPDGGPAEGQWLMLRAGSRAIPLSVFANHLQTRGLSVQTDAAGRIVIPGLPAGSWDVFIQSSEARSGLVAGRPVDLLGSVTVTPGGVAELETTVAVEP